MDFKRAQQISKDKIVLENKYYAALADLKNMEDKHHESVKRNGELEQRMHMLIKDNYMLK